VAGTIAAKNNMIGVVGVAAGATVIPVKVSDDDRRTPLAVFGSYVIIVPITFQMSCSLLL
jgi:Subtilase family